MEEPECGSNVSSWLGPPASHRTMTDLARGSLLFSASSASSWPRGVSHVRPATPAIFSNVRREKCSGPQQEQFLNSEDFIASMVPRKFRSVEQRPIKIFHRL